MPIIKVQTSPTTVKLTINADQLLMTEVKDEVLKRLSRDIKLPGFRQGKVPLSMVEKQIDFSVFQSEFIDEVVNRLYTDTIKNENMRPVDQPKITIGKFVPFTTLEFTAEVECVGEVKLPDYTKIRLPKKVTNVTAKEVDGVIEELQKRVADRIEVKRAAKEGDQVIIDFNGKDATTDEPIKGADGTDYPLILGSNSFIPGFEANLVGLKQAEKKTFTLRFPKDYSVSTLRNRNVVFKVTAKRVQKLDEPTIDDAFAAKVSPFKLLKELRDDIEKQLLAEKQAESDRTYGNELLDMIASSSKVAIPEVLITEEIGRLEQQDRQNASYRAQTWQEFLAGLNKTEVEYQASLRAPAEQRVKVGLVLTEVADREHITVTPEEFEVRLQLLKGQYQDRAMQAELDKPDNQRSILSRMLSEKTIAHLSGLASSKAK